MQIFNKDKEEVYVCWDIIYLSKSNHIGGCKNVQNTKKCSILHILTQKTPTSVFVKMCKYTPQPCKWIVTVHIYTVTVHVQMIFLFFFSLLYQTTSLPLRLQQLVASPTFTTTQRDRIRRMNQKITTQPPNTTT